MHNLLLSLALLLPQADGEHYGHAPEQCPNKPGPCPNKPKPEPAPEPAPAPKPNNPPRPMLPDLGLSQEDLIALAVAAAAIGVALYLASDGRRKLDR